MPGTLNPKYVNEIVSADTTTNTAEVQAIVDAEFVEQHPIIVNEAVTKVNGNMVTEVTTQVDAKIGQNIIDQVTFEMIEMKPSMVTEVETKVNDRMQYTVTEALNARQPTIVSEVRATIVPEIDTAVVAHKPSMVQQITDATNANIDTLVGSAVTAQHPSIVAAVWADVDVQMQQQLNDAFLANQTTIVNQVLNSIGDPMREEVVIASNRGIKANANHRYSGGSIAAGSDVFNDVNNTFSLSDVGKLMYVVGAGTNGHVLATTIAAHIDNRTVRLQHMAVVGVTNAEYVFGTDDTAAWIALVDSIADNMVSAIMIPYGMSLTDPFPMKTNMTIMGQQSGNWVQTKVSNCSGLLLKPGVKSAALLRSLDGSVVNAQLSRVFLNGLDRFHPNTITRYAGGSLVKDSSNFTDIAANFTAADLGKKIVVYGGGASADSDYVGTITAIVNPQTVTCDTASDPHPAAVTLSNLAYSYGFYTAQGLDGATTAGSAVFNAASAAFTADHVGQAIELVGAMQAQWAGDTQGETLSTVIAAVNSPTQVVLAKAPEQTLTGVQWRAGMVHGIYQVPAANGQTAAWDCDHVVIKNFSGNGVVIGENQNENRFFKTYIWRCRGMGAILNSEHNELVQSFSSQCGLDGVRSMRASNRFTNFNAIRNNGNGIYLPPQGEQAQLTNCNLDLNDKNGLLCFAKGVQKVSVRFKSNSQCKNAAYSDVAYTRRHSGGVVSSTPTGNMLVAGYWTLAGNGNKPNWGVESAGPNTIHGTGMQFDMATSPFAAAAVSQGNVFGIQQGSFALDPNTVITLLNNNALVSTGMLGAKVGQVPTEKWGFWGATPVERPIVTGNSNNRGSVLNIAAALHKIGLIDNQMT